MADNDNIVVSVGKLPNKQEPQQPEEQGAAQRAPNPEANAGFISRLLFLWVNPLFSLSKKKRRAGAEIEDGDLWALAPQDTTASLRAKFEAGWKRGVARAKLTTNSTPTDDNAPQSLTDEESYGALVSALWAVGGKGFKNAGFVKLVSTTVDLSMPVLLNLVLTFIARSAEPDTEDVAKLAAWEANKPEAWEGYALAAGIGMATLVQSIADNAYIHSTWRVAYQVRSSVTTAVYRKSLTLSSASRQGKTVGEIVNFMQLDAERMEKFAIMGHDSWDAFVQVGVLVTLLYTYIGWAAFVSLGAMFAVLPVFAILLCFGIGAMNKMAGATDARVKTTNELLQGMLGVKMAAWEENFADAIKVLRNREIGLLRRILYIMCVIMSLMDALPALVATSAITTYALYGGEVDAPTLFTALAVFAQLRYPLILLPQAVSTYADAKIGARRVSGFLALDDVDTSQARSNSSGSGSVAITIQDGEFFWGDPVKAAEAEKQRRAEEDKKEKKGKKNKNKTKSKAIKGGVAIESWSTNPSYKEPVVQLPTLQDINIKFGRGKLSAIVGPVGCGKSSLCNAILGEMYKTKGQVGVHGDIAYAAQSAWMLNATVRDNILFGEDFDEARYRRVLEVCQLTHDLDILESGDMTMIGERGINLSGGQKQRISVARVAYSHKQIVVLDDPLSALDPAVAAKMFKECIVNFLGDRTRVLVTNQLNLLKDCDWVVVLSNNSPGSSSSTSGASSASEGAAGRITEQGTYAQLNGKGMDFAALLERHARGAGRHRKSTAASSIVGEEEEGGDGVGKDGGDVLDKAADDLMTEEERSRGAVTFAVYAQYIRSGGGWCAFALVFLCFVIQMAAMLASPQWVAIWTEQAITGYNNSLGAPFPDWDTWTETDPNTFFAIGYGATAVLVAFTGFVQQLAMTVFALRAAVMLHEKLLGSVLAAPMSFFDQTPTGRILSRFSKDTEEVATVGQMLAMAISSFLTVISTLGMILYGTPIFGAVLPVLGVFYVWILHRIRPVNRDLKRLDAIARSPVFAHFSETLGGVSTIRAFGVSSTFVQQSADKVDNNIRNFYMLKASERWLMLQLGFFGTLVTTAAAVFAVYASQDDSISASQAGVSLNLSLQVTMVLTMAVRSVAELEGSMNSVERVRYYSTQIDQEAPRTTRKPPPKSWPAEGRLVVKDLHMRYRKDTPLVIKGVSFTVEGGERVGIVGRTGCGKSSLMLCLLRLVEPEFEGKQGPITLDGIDITKIGLLELRRKISIVPQNPVIFSGTIRSNLDPFKRYTDASIWDALEKCNLKAMVAEHELKLLQPVSEYGENFSNGERQLLCMVRSLLESCKVLLLDEATSSVDFETDELIQKTIRAPEAFGGCTILTIAHRINTVIDSDKILVLDQGTVAEYDAPRVLLANPNSILSSMAGEK